MNIMREALEACQNCPPSGAARHISSNSENNKPEDSGATYNDGKGVQDTVLINGPLSHTFTQAINIALKKDPLVQEPPEPTIEDAVEETVEAAAESTPKDSMLKQNTPGKVGFGTESAQLEAEQNNFLIREFDTRSEEVKFLANKFDFADPDDLPTNIVCNTIVIGYTDFMRPSNLVRFMEDKSQSSVDHVVMVVADGLGRTSDTTRKEMFLKVNTGGGIFSDSEAHREFTAVVENHIAPNGYKVMISVEEYLAHLRKLAKDLYI